jgi:hypothetical protein
MNVESQEYKDLVAHALTIPLEERERIATEAVDRMERDRKAADKKVKELIPEASEMPSVNSMIPSIFIAIKSNGEYHVGINYQPIGTRVGDFFHNEHCSENSEAMVHWIK